jgi:hypothetical protein
MGPMDATAQLQARSTAYRLPGKEALSTDMSEEIGAGEAIRTPDPNLGKVVLYP